MAMRFDRRKYDFWQSCSKWRCIEDLGSGWWRRWWRWFELVKTRNEQTIVSATAFSIWPIRSRISQSAFLVHSPRFLLLPQNDIDAYLQSLSQFAYILPGVIFTGGDKGEKNGQINTVAAAVVRLIIGVLGLSSAGLDDDKVKKLELAWTKNQRLWRAHCGFNVAHSFQRFPNFVLANRKMVKVLSTHASNQKEWSCWPEMQLACMQMLAIRPVISTRW